MPEAGSSGVAAVVVSSTRLSWSSSTAVASWWRLASVCTLLRGICIPELLGLIAPSRDAKVIASAIEASTRNSESGSRRRIRRVADAALPDRHEHGVASLGEARAQRCRTDAGDPVARRGRCRRGGCGGRLAGCGLFGHGGERHRPRREKQWRSQKRHKADHDVHRNDTPRAVFTKVTQHLPAVRRSQKRHNRPPRQRQSSPRRDVHRGWPHRFTLIAVSAPGASPTPTQ